jgi:hypothetical protein
MKDATFKLLGTCDVTKKKKKIMKPESSLETEE